MKIEDQVCELDLAKRLKELGVQQDSHFCWYAFENPLYGIICEDDVTVWEFGEYKVADKGGADWIYSAFTVGEMGEILLEIPGGEDHMHWHIDKKEANKRAKVLICLLENGFIKEPNET
jgi:hypothetical protein